MRLARSVRRRFGISAPRLAVRMHVPWYWRGLALLGAVALVGWLLYQNGQRLAFTESGIRARLEEANARLEKEGTLLRRAVLSAEGQLGIERAAREDLARQMRTLEGENAQLKEDLAFFQTLASTDGRPAGIGIHRFKVEAAAPGEYRYRLLLLQSGQREREFSGAVQLTAYLQQGVRMVAQPVGAAEGRMEVRFRFYRRVEGVLRVPAGSDLKSIEARVYENGSDQPKVAQTTSLLQH